jgi:hypothetical protein
MTYSNELLMAGDFPIGQCRVGVTCSAKHRLEKFALGIPARRPICAGLKVLPTESFISTLHPIHLRSIPLLCVSIALEAPQSSSFTTAN